MTNDEMKEIKYFGDVGFLYPYDIRYDADDRAFFQLAREVEDAGVELLAEHKPDRSLQTNVEFYTAVLLDGIGGRLPRESAPAAG